MADELIPYDGPPAPDDKAPADPPAEPPQPPAQSGHQVFDPLVPLGYVDTDEETAGVEWNLPPAGDRRETMEAARAARRADEDAEHARRRGDTGFAVQREADAGENRQMGWADWGDFRTWAIIGAMFFGFLLVVAAVYFTPTGRHNQNDGPLSVPAFRGY